MLGLAASVDSLRWTPRAVHDTVAAIARQAAYHRSYTSSVYGRLIRWLTDLWTRILSPLYHLPKLRTIVLLLAGLFVVVLVVRMILSARAAGADERRARGAAAGEALPDPWRQADGLASAGQFTAAAHALYEALLARLSARGVVRLHPSKTAGDYARELGRRRAAEHPPFELFRRRYDRLIYGTGACSAEDYAALLQDARPLLERAA